jgi:hypothetical protein
MAEIREFHPYYVAVQAESGTDAALMISHMLSSATLMCFLLAVLFDLQYPMDTGQCSSLHDTNEATCLSQTSPFNAAESLCAWDAEYSECNFVLRTVSVEDYVLVTILTLVLVVPFQVVIDLIYDKVLYAPTARDIDIEDQAQLQRQQSMRASMVGSTSRMTAFARRASNVISTGVKRGSVAASRAVRTSIGHVRDQFDKAAKNFGRAPLRKDSQVALMQTVVSVSDEVKAAHLSAQRAIDVNVVAQTQLMAVQRLFLNPDAHEESQRRVQGLH